MSDIVDQLYDKIEEGRSGKNLGLKTGLPKLDWYTGGFQKGVYKLFFGNSGTGKSSLVIYNDVYRILKDYPEKDIKHVVFSLEMSCNVLLAKLLNLYIFEEYGKELSYLSLLSVRNPLSKEDYEYVLKARSWLESISDKLIIYDEPLHAKSFYAIMKGLLEKWGTFTKSADGRRLIYVPNNKDCVVNVVLDHIGLCSPQNGRDEKQEMDLISKYCVWFRETCEVSFDVIMQENRNAGNIDRQKANLSEPTLDDTKGSGNPVNDATIVIAIYSPIKYQLNTYRGYTILGESGLGSVMKGIILLKNRFGTGNKVFCTGFQGSIGKFEELPKPELIDYSSYQLWKEEKQEDSADVKVSVAEDNKKSIFSF